MPALVSYHRADKNRLLPFVLQIHLCYRNVEFTVQTREQGLDICAFFFERGATGDVEVNCESSDHGFRRARRPLFYER